MGDIVTLAFKKIYGQYIRIVIEKKKDGVADGLMIFVIKIGMEKLGGD